MPALASCYFCGEAVGASLDEYDLPAGAPADEQVAITLCARCEGKLSALLEEIEQSTAAGSSAPVFEADAATDALTDATTDALTDATTEAATDAGADEASDPSDDAAADPVAGDREPIFADDEGAVLGEDLPLEDPVGDGPFGAETDAEETPDTAADAGDEDPKEVADAKEPKAATGAVDAEDAGESTDADGSAGADGSTPAVDSGDADGDSENADGEPIAAPPAGEHDDEPSTDADATTESEPDAPTTDDDADDHGVAAETSAVEVGADGAGTTTERDGGTAADGPLADVSPRTYNRVVRLLQNREFPVDRADFEALATSAYELDHGECAAALDGAIEKGLLAERGGQLHRPE